MKDNRTAIDQILDKVTALGTDVNHLNANFGTHLALHEVEMKKREEDIKESKEWKKDFGVKLDSLVNDHLRINNDLYHPETGIVKQNRLMWEKLGQIKAVWGALVILFSTMVYLLTEVIGIKKPEIKISQYEQPIQYEQQRYPINN